MTLWRRTPTVFRRCLSGPTRLPPFKLMPMPRLSPTMMSGTLLKWRVAEGAPLPESGMDVTCDVVRAALPEKPEKN